MRKVQNHSGPSQRKRNAIGVMQIVDTLEMGGAERVAVNIANCLANRQVSRGSQGRYSSYLYCSYLCTTRRDGPLEALVSPGVGRLRLNRRYRLDTWAIRRMAAFIKANEIRILHAHGASIFMASAAAWFAPGVQVIWHDHFGRCGTEERPAWLYRMALRRAAGAIVVNEMLAEWSRSRLKFAADRVVYVPNFVAGGEAQAGQASLTAATARGAEELELPGRAGARIVCVANFRPQKDHINLIRAMERVVRQVKDAQLLLVGQVSDDAHCQAIRAEIAARGLGARVTFLGERGDVPEILRACEIGVLASSSEGLPLSLLEYGVAGLAAVATRVGQCAEVLENGKAGVLVAPVAPEELGEAIVALLLSPEKRAELGVRLRERVASVYSAEAAMRQICGAYERALKLGARGEGVSEDETEGAGDDVEILESSRPRFASRNDEVARVKLG